MIKICAFPLHLDKIDIYILLGRLCIIKLLTKAYGKYYWFKIYPGKRTIGIKYYVSSRQVMICHWCVSCGVGDVFCDVCKVQISDCTINSAL